MGLRLIVKLILDLLLFSLPLKIIMPSIKAKPSKVSRLQKNNRVVKIWSLYQNNIQILPGIFKNKTTIFLKKHAQFKMSKTLQCNRKRYFFRTKNTVYLEVFKKQEGSSKILDSLSDRINSKIWAVCCPNNVLILVSNQPLHGLATNNNYPK